MQRSRLERLLFVWRRIRTEEVSVQKSRPAAHSHKKIYSADTFVGGSIRLLKIAEHRVGVQNTGPARRITVARLCAKKLCGESRIRLRFFRKTFTIIKNARRQGVRKNDCKVACGLFYGGAVCGSCAAKTAKLPRHCFAEVSRPLFANGCFAWRAAEEVL